MAENDNESNVNTTGADKDKQQQQKQAKNQNTNPVQKAQKTKKQMGILRKFVKLISAFPIIGYVLIAILIFLFCWGVIGFFTTLPGTYIESIKEFGEKLWGGLIHYYSEDIVTSSVTEKDQIALAQKLQDMGYDVVGYGFADASYEYDNEENAGDIDGFTNGTITGISTLSDNRNYLQAYIAQSEATYVLANWSVAGALKSGPAGWLDWLFGTNFVDDSEIQEYSEGLINITTLSLNKEKYDPEEFRELQGRMGINVDVDRENKIMKIISHRTGANTNYYFDLSNWTSLYGKPLELFLSLHLGTMMPDLAYEFATSEAFNTKVNIALQEVQSTFKVIYRKEDSTEITQEDIERVYLSTICNMTESQINNFANAGKLDDAFETILGSITDIREDYLNLQNGGTINEIGTDVSTHKGFNLTQAEESILGQPYTRVQNITIRRYDNNNENQENRVVEEEREFFDRYIRVIDIDNESELNSIQSALDASVLSGITAEQLKDLGQLILDGMQEENVYLPRIESITKHWFYNTINYEYGTAGRAKKKIQYETEDEESSLSEENLNGATIILDTTFTNASGVFYQLAEPEVTGPNEAIKTLFKGGTVTMDGETYEFPGEYYRYDGTRLTALKIANAKAYDEGKSSYTFQNKVISEVYNPNEEGEWEIHKGPVTFATEDADGNKSYNDAFTAFAILENVHSLEADTVYRLFKELVIELNYFTREDFMKPLTQVLLWPVERVGSDTETGDIEVEDVTKGIYKETNQYGLFLDNGVAVNSGDTIIAPGDATVTSVNGDTITLKFKTISDGNAAALQEKFGTDYFDVDRDIVLDMEMTISGINASVSAGQSISAGSTIGTATSDDMRIIMYNIDKSIVEDIETYMYPTYKGTSLGIFETIGEGE